MQGFTYFQKLLLGMLIPLADNQNQTRVGVPTLARLCGLDSTAFSEELSDLKQMGILEAKGETEVINDRGHQVKAPILEIDFDKITSFLCFDFKEYRANHSGRVADLHAWRMQFDSDYADFHQKKALEKKRVEQTELERVTQDIITNHLSELRRCEWTYGVSTIWEYLSEDDVLSAKKYLLDYACIVGGVSFWHDFLLTMKEGKVLLGAKTYATTLVDICFEQRFVHPKTLDALKPFEGIGLNAKAILADELFFYLCKGEQQKPAMRSHKESLSIFFYACLLRGEWRFWHSLSQYKAFLSLKEGAPASNTLH